MNLVLSLTHFLARLLVSASDILLMLSKLLFMTVSYRRFSSTADDVFIVSYPRSGTTMLQMILYQLTFTTRRPWDEITHISQEIPYFERMLARKGGIQPESGGRRVFKTHFRRRHLKRLKGRFLYIWRDVEDVAWSYYHFYVAYHRYKGTYDDFVDLFLTNRVQAGSWAEHVGDWLGQERPENVLVIRYEDLVERTEPVVREIANFCRIEASDALIARTVSMSSFRSMKENESKFDHATELLLESGIRSGSFIRAGEVEGGRRDGLPKRHGDLRNQYERVMARSAVSA